MCSTDLVHLMELEKGIREWQKDKHHDFNEYLAYVDYIRGVESDDVLEGFVCCYFGVKEDSGYDFVLVNLEERYHDLELLLYFNVDGYDVDGTNALEVVGINVNSLLNRGSEHISGLDRIIEIQKMYNKEPSHEVVTYDLNIILQGCMEVIHGKLKLLQLGVPNQLDTTEEICQVNNIEIEDLCYNLNLDVRGMKTLDDMTCMPVLSYHKIIGCQVLTALGVVGLNALLVGYSVCNDLRKTDAEKSRELFDHYNKTLDDYYTTYYSHVASIIPEALHGLICIISLCMADDYALHNVLKTRM